MLSVRAGRDEQLDDFGIDRRASPRDRLDGRPQLRAVVNALFQEVAAADGAVEQCERIRRLRVLAQHDHPDGRVGGAEPRGHLDPFVEVRRRHPDVC
jgi:hypothetical protein